MLHPIHTLYMHQKAIETVKSATQTIHTLQLRYYKKELQSPWMGEHKLGHSIKKKNLCLHGDNVCLCLEQTCTEKATRNLFQELQVPSNRQLGML